MKSGTTNTVMTLLGHLGVSGVGLTGLVAALHAGPGGTADPAAMGTSIFLVLFSVFQMYLHAHEDQPWVQRVEALEAQVQAALTQPAATAPSAPASGLRPGLPAPVAGSPIPPLGPTPAPTAGGSAPSAVILGTMSLAIALLGGGCKLIESPAALPIEAGAADLGSVALQAEVAKEAKLIVKQDPNAGPYLRTASQVILADIGSGQYNPTNIVADLNLSSFNQAHGAAAEGLAGFVTTYESAWTQAALARQTNLAAVLRPVATAIANGLAAGAAQN